MTIKDLKARLEPFPDEMEVRIDDSDGEVVLDSVKLDYYRTKFDNGDIETTCFVKLSGQFV